MFRLRHLVLLGVFPLGSCGEGASELRATLPNGAEVTVGTRGELAVVVAGREVFATAPGHAPDLHAFDMQFAQGVGFYEFVRLNEVVTPFDRVRSRRATGGQVEVALAAANGATATIVVSDGPIPASTRIRLTVAANGAAHASTSIPLRCDDDASFLGFGEQYNTLDQRGEAFPLWSQEQGIGRGGNLWIVEGDAHTTYLPMPYFLDARGFGLVVQTQARVLVDLCSTDPEVARIDVEQAQPVDLVVLHGPTPKHVVTQLGDVYGRPAALPDWSLGPWIGIQGGQQAVLDEADSLDAAGVPYTALWAQDWVGRRDFTSDQVGVQYRWTVDAALYPDLAGLISTLHARDKRFLGYANPWIVMPLEHYAPMDAAGMLIRNAVGSSYVMSTASLQPGSMPDLGQQATRDYIAGFLDAMVNDYGMDGWMCDFGEALPVDSFLADGTTGWLAHNGYPGAWHGLNVERLRAARPDGDFALFSRSGWLGAQGTAQIVWVGDQEADFSEEDGLPTVVPAMLNLGLSAVPFTTHDIAGFSGGPSTKELFERWTELGAFTLIMRTHEGLRRAENWGWDGGDTASTEDAALTTTHFRRFARIHQALEPVFLQLMDEAATNSIPPLRAMLLEFPDDPAARTLDDQFMVGTDLLVAPVVHEGAVSREVYFPAGTWTHALRPAETHTGPARVTVAAPIGTPPVFWRGAPVVDLASID